ncbi:unnamed protein product, partial [Ectocarpus fasciculatus]
QVPGGQNASIAVMSYSGYDIEDAVVLNRGSLDRGFGRCMVFRKHQVPIRKYPNGTQDKIVGKVRASEFPRGEDDPRWPRYKALDEDGICRVGARLDPGTIMVNKHSPASTSGSAPVSSDFASTPLSYKAPAESYVDKVVLTANENEDYLIKILLRQTRRPEVGDKFSSRHGQKGVCGIIVPQEDMPFADSGICPDLIMNPHGFPSRMTVGKMVELVAGKAGVLHGHQAYGTAFGEEHGSADRVHLCCQ